MIKKDNILITFMFYRRFICEIPSLYGTFGELRKLLVLMLAFQEPPFCSLILQKFEACTKIRSKSKRDNIYFHFRNLKKCFHGHTRFWTRLFCCSYTGNRKMATFTSAKCFSPNNFNFEHLKFWTWMLLSYIFEEFGKIFTPINLWLNTSLFVWRRKNEEGEDIKRQKMHDKKSTWWETYVAYLFRFLVHASLDSQAICIKTKYAWRHIPAVRKYFVYASEILK